MTEQAEHALIVVPGLGDDKPWQQSLTASALKSWERYGFAPEIHIADWHEGLFEPKQEDLLGLIALRSTQYDRVSLLGLSAGGILVANSLAELGEADDIHRVVTANSMLRRTDARGFRRFDKRVKSSPAFQRGIEVFKLNEPDMSPEQRQKVMTVRARFGDELVPSKSSTLEGATNVQIPTTEHMFSIYMALTVFRGRIVEFLSEQSE